MNKYHFFLFTVSFFISTLCCSQNEQDLIKWDKNYKLKWGDFKGKIDLDNSYGAMSAVGFQMGNFKWMENIGVGFLISIFNASDSWTKTQSNELGLKQIGRAHV